MPARKELYVQPCINSPIQSPKRVRQPFGLIVDYTGKYDDSPVFVLPMIPLKTSKRNNGTGFRKLQIKFDNTPH